MSQIEADLDRTPLSLHEQYFTIQCKSLGGGGGGWAVGGRVSLRSRWTWTARRSPCVIYYELYHNISRYNIKQLVVGGCVSDRGGPGPDAAGAGLLQPGAPPRRRPLCNQIKLAQYCNASPAGRRRCRSRASPTRRALQTPADSCNAMRCKGRRPAAGGSSE